MAAARRLPSLILGWARASSSVPEIPLPSLPAGAPAPKGPLPKPDPRYSLTFNLNAQNLFNDVNAGPPVGVLTSPQFGHSISLNSPYGGGNANRVIMLQSYFNF